MADLTATPPGVSSAGRFVPAPAVEVTNLHRRFGDTTAVAGVSLSVQPGEFFSLLGPSGCGKTTFLRLLAGLDTPDEGDIHLGGVNCDGVPAHRRPVNTVFQSYALFPHLSVRDNIAFGLRMKKTPASEVAVRVSQAMELVEIARLADRKPAQLSGGEQQRVAVARAIVNEPKVLLLDEPLGALDLKLRRQLQGELHALQRRLGITFIHVTHDQEEALAMSDRLAVMNAGRVEQLGVPKEVYERPRTRFVAQFLGACNLLDTTVLREDAASMWVASPLGQLRLTPAAKIRRPAAGASLAVAIRPEKVQLFTEAPPMENCVHAWLTELSYTGAQTQYLVAACGVPLEAAVVNAAGPQHLCQIGQEVWVHLPPEGLIILED